ncbi:MAG: hypothetical protein AAF799_43840 [Myxococcota bacterium]
MKNSPWILVASMLVGCSSNTVTLDGDDTATQGPVGDTELPQTDGGPTPPHGECSDQNDCGGDCQYCDEGACVEDPGCCWAQPGEDPWVFRCSPPVDCWDDTECGSGEECINNECMPEQGPMVYEPPICDEDLVLTVDQLGLGDVVEQIAAPSPGLLLAVDSFMHIRQVDLDTGALGSSIVQLSGDAVFELVAGGPSRVVAVVHETLKDGSQGHHTLVAHREDAEAWAVDQSPSYETPALGVTRRPEPNEVYIASTDEILRTEIGPPLAGLNALPLTTPVGRIQSVAAGNGEHYLGVDALFGIEMLEPVDGEILGSTASYDGIMVDLAAVDGPGTGEGERLVVLTHLPPEDAELEPDITAVQVMGLDIGFAPSTPFGTDGVPLDAEAADMDGDGIEDIVVAMQGGRLDVYLMDDEGPRCRAFLPLGGISDVEVGDLDDDGTDEVLIVDSDSTLSIVAGSAG